MAIPRRELVDETRSSLVHCISRCVRQAFLLAAGPDGTTDDHRRDWTVARLRLLGEAFAIDCISLAVMSSHLHLLVRTMPELVGHWSDEEVAFRWLLLHPPRMLRRRTGVDPDSPPLPEEVARLAADAGGTKRRRERLSSLSWYMKELKEWLSRRANREEGKTGAFWEERFRSIPVLDDAAALLCATYIDLNPVAAGMADDPLRARYTSVQEHAWRASAVPAIAGEDEEDVRAAIEAFVASFDGKAFTAAVPARREAHLPARARVGGDEAGKEVCCPSARAGSDVPRAADGQGTVKRGPPVEAVLGIGMGDYFRRLRLLGAMARTRRDARLGTGPRHSARPGIELSLGREADATALSRLAVAMCGGDPSAAMEVLGELLIAPRLFGSALGSPASLAAEAARRGRRNVVMALRAKPPPRAPCPGRAAGVAPSGAA